MAREEQLGGRPVMKSETKHPRKIAMCFVLALLGCGPSVNYVSRCANACQPAGFDTTRGGCICMDGGWSRCACDLLPIECAASGGQEPREWRIDP
jgi:recombinational DNA repair protein (RecF pathway)